MLQELPLNDNTNVLFPVSSHAHKFKLPHGMLGDKPFTLLSYNNF